MEIGDGLDPSALAPFTLAVKKFKIDVFFKDLVPFIRSFSNLFFKVGPFYTKFLQPFSRFLCIRMVCGWYCQNIFCF